MFQRSTRLNAAMGAGLGGIVVMTAAWQLASFQPDPTLVDRSFPLVAVSVWILAARTTLPGWREVAMLLVPVSFAIELSIPETGLRLLLLGAVLAAAALLHLAQASQQWETGEILTASAILVPIRLVEPSWSALIAQSLLIAGAVLLWREMRRGGASQALSAAAVLLLAVTLPAGSLRVALVPWVVTVLLFSLRREFWIARIVAIGGGLVVARWLGAAVALIMVAVWIGRRLSGSGSPAFVPTLQATAGNLPATLAALPFFPSAYRSFGSIAAVIAPAALALIVRPSLAAPVVAIGIVSACALRREERIFGDAGSAALVLSPLVLVATIMLFFPWSGTIPARPPAPLPLFVILAIAATALLPATVRAWSGVAGFILFAAVIATTSAAPDQRREVGRALAAGEALVIPLEGTWENLEVLLAGANLAGTAHGTAVATVEVLDSRARGYSRSAAIGDLADWGAFRPDLLLSTMNPRPDEPVVLEGYGASSWVRGTGRIRFPSVSGPRSVTITASPFLNDDERVIVEEIRFR